MRCPACGFENGSGIKFCGECGTSLKVKRQSCGFANASGIKFCGDCGKAFGETARSVASPDPRSYTPKHLAEKILTSRSALEGDLRRMKAQRLRTASSFTEPGGSPGAWFDLH